MEIRKHSGALVALAVFAAAGIAAPVHAASATLKGEYLFDNTLTSDVAGAPALTVTDPQATSGFVTDTVLGGSHTVYNFVGNASPVNQQAGLTLDTTGLLTSNSYSVEMYFKFAGGNNAWRRIIDVNNRQSDDGFYANPSNSLAVYPVAGSSSNFLAGTYRHVVLTDDAGVVNGYLDGNPDFTTVSTTVMDISNPSNPGLLMNFFLDNVVGGGQGEYSSGDIAMLRVYDGVLTADQVKTLSDNILVSQAPPPVPEPATIGVLGGGAAMLLVRRRRR